MYIDNGVIAHKNAESEKKQTEQIDKHIPGVCVWHTIESNVYSIVLFQLYIIY